VTSLIGTKPSNAVVRRFIHGLRVGPYLLFVIVEPIANSYRDLAFQQ